MIKLQDFQRVRLIPDSGVVKGKVNALGILLPLPQDIVVRSKKRLIWNLLNSKYLVSGRRKGGCPGNFVQKGCGPRGATLKWSLGVG